MDAAAAVKKKRIVSQVSRRNLCVPEKSQEGVSISHPTRLHTYTNLERGGEGERGAGSSSSGSRSIMYS